MSNENAREEFNMHVARIGKKVYCSEIYTEEWDEYDYRVRIYRRLYVGHTAEDYSLFLKGLDFNYDSGYGSQNLFGTIWFTDMTWSNREEYDGSEWWAYNSVPEIPFELWRNIDGQAKDNKGSNTGDSRLYSSSEGGETNLSEDRI